MVMGTHERMTATASATKEVKHYPPGTMDADPEHLLVENVAQLGLQPCMAWW